MRYDPDTWARADGLKLDGLSDYEISRQMGIPRSSIYNHYVRKGWPDGSLRATSSTAPEGSGWGGLVFLGVWAGAWLLAWLLRRRQGDPAVPPKPQTRLGLGTNSTPPGEIFGATPRSLGGNVLFQLPPPPDPPYFRPRRPGRYEPGTESS